MQYTANADTILKKEPVQGSTLPDDQKVNVPKGTTYGIEQVIKTDGLHSYVELQSGAGSWWIYLPHWDTGTTGIVTAVFTLEQAHSTELINGSLTFKDDGSQILIVVASSGLPGYQYAGAHTITGKGCIPPANDWKINTNGYYLATQGIEGMFYHITPDPRFGRSEIGLHRDANVPGSSGCIVVRDSNTFNNQVVPFIDGLANKQSQITLSVVYT